MGMTGARTMLRRRSCCCASSSCWVERGSFVVVSALSSTTMFDDGVDDDGALLLGDGVKDEESLEMRLINRASPAAFNRNARKGCILTSVNGRKIRQRFFVRCSFGVLRSTSGGRTRSSDWSGRNCERGIQQRINVTSKVCCQNTSNGLLLCSFRGLKPSLLVEEMGVEEVVVFGGAWVVGPCGGALFFLRDEERNEGVDAAGGGAGGGRGAAFVVVVVVAVPARLDTSHALPPGACSTQNSNDDDDDIDEPEGIMPR